MSNITKHLIKSPYYKDNNIERAAIWQQLRELAALFSHHPHITASEKKQLALIAQYQLTFRQPARYLQQLQVILKKEKADFNVELKCALTKVKR